MDSLRATIGSSILAPEITNSTIGKDENEEAKMVDEDTKDGSSDFILYFLFPGLEKLVGRVSKRMQFNFPPCPEKLIPYRDYVDAYFEVSHRGSTIQLEINSGLVHFFSCVYIMAIIPNQMEKAGYDQDVTASTLALIVGIATIANGIISNTPLVIAPPTAIAIFFVTSSRSNGLSTHDGNMAVFYSGCMVLIVSLIGPIGIFLSKLIPETIQASTAMGVGLISALAGYVEIGLIEQGEYSILSLGKITNEVVIATSGLILIALLQFYHSKFSYLFGLTWGTFIWWSYKDSWPVQWGAAPTFRTDYATTVESRDALLLMFELFILHMLLAFGLARALIDLVGKSARRRMSLKDSGNSMVASIPKGRYIFIVIALANIMSGLMYGPPIVISPESSAGIRAGAKTGLSSVVCGSIFCVVAIHFGPLFSAIPAAGTSPVLIMVGLLLFRNVIRVDFSSKYGMPAFVCLGLIPFTNSAIAGIAFGYATYIAIAIVTGGIALEYQSFKTFLAAYRNNLKAEDTNSAPPYPHDVEEGNDTPPFAIKSPIHNTTKHHDNDDDHKPSEDGISMVRVLKEDGELAAVKRDVEGMENSSQTDDFTTPPSSPLQRQEGRGLHEGQRQAQRDTHEQSSKETSGDGAHRGEFKIDHSTSQSISNSINNSNVTPRLTSALSAFSFSSPKTQTVNGKNIKLGNLGPLSPLSSPTPRSAPRTKSQRRASTTMSLVVEADVVSGINKQVIL